MSLLHVGRNLCNAVTTANLVEQGACILCSLLTILRCRFELDLHRICRRRLWRSSADFRGSRCVSHPLSVASATLETLYETALDNKILVGKEELDMIGRQKATVVDFKSLKVPSKDDEDEVNFVTTTTSKD